MTKIVNMEAYTIADQDDDEDFWQLQRRRHVTASDLIKFVPEHALLEYGWWIEPWMGRDHEGEYHDMGWVRQDIFSRKLTGRQLKFKDPVAVKWGSAEEDHNRALFGKYAGVEVEGSHALIKDDRWPYLAGSLDGYMMGNDTLLGAQLDQPEMFDKPGHVQRALDTVGPGTCLLEMKQTSDFGYAHWSGGKKGQPKKLLAGRFEPQPASVPVYYRPQLFTQMAITGRDKIVAVVKGGASHMTAHAMHLPESWLAVLDDINEIVGPEMEEIRKALDNE